MKIQNYTLLLLLFLLSCKKDSPIVNPEPPAKSSEKKILSFKFTSITPEATGTIDESSKKVTINVPYGTIVTSIKPIISVSEKATVNNTAPADFLKAVTYKVTAEDGTTQDYVVTTTISNPKFSIDTYTGPRELEAGNGYFLLKGKGFGTDASKVQLLLANTVTGIKTAISTFSLLNDVSIGLTIPENLPFASYTVEVVVNGEKVPTPITLTIVQVAPVIESLSSSSLAQSEVLTINGRFFAQGSSLSITFKSKTTGTVYTITKAESDLINATTNKLEVKVSRLPGGTYTVQVNSNGKVSAAKDLEVIAPPAGIKPVILSIKNPNNSTPFTFRMNELMVISVQYLTDPVRPTIKFLSTTSPVVYSRTGWVSSQSMGNSEIKYEIERDFPKGSYKIAIETSDGKTSDEFKEAIQIL